MKPALIVVDVQKAFFEHDPVTTQSLEQAIETINAAIALFRDKHLPVIAVQDLEPEENVMPGEVGFELPDQLNVLDSDLHIHKSYGNAFNKTPLEDELKKRGVDTVIVTGFSAAQCVLATYQGAEDRDLKPILLRGAIASGTPEHIRFVEDISSIISYGALKQVLE